MTKEEFERATMGEILALAKAEIASNPSANLEAALLGYEEVLYERALKLFRGYMHEFGIGHLEGGVEAVVKRAIERGEHIKWQVTKA